ncbi:F-box incomplete domain containing protein [Pandoravirus japonicus]|uniref:F-box incomplete domain containing protein n=1 Tax=Pandoravirus japonicus TaxID=2823154 RepID=A0A811BS91_9VIRU|nr:F-box incomplete domain containing protein [Pandoravirus japonicus]
MDNNLTDFFLCDDAKNWPRAEVSRSPQGCPARDKTPTAHASIYDLPVEIVAHVLNGLDLLGRPLFDPSWRFAARATCRPWRDIIDTATTAEARAMVRAWRYGRADGRRRAQCLCAPCTHDSGGGLKHLIATGRLVTATCAVGLGADRNRHGDGDDLFGPLYPWCASSIPEQDAALCAAMMKCTREAIDRVVLCRLAPLFACDADGRCPVRAIERADIDGCDRVKGAGACNEDHQTECDDGRRLIVDLLAVAARQGRVTLLASLAALSERVRTFAREAVAALVYYACMADRADTVVWVLRGIMDAEAHDHPLSPVDSSPLADPVAYRTWACSNVWKAVAEYDAADTMAAVLKAFGQYAETHLDLHDAKWAPHNKPWQRRAARSGSARVLQVCREHGLVLDLDTILADAATYGHGTVVRWALAQKRTTDPTSHIDVYWAALGLAAAESARIWGRDTDLAIDSLCDAIRATYVSHAEAAQAAVAWWRTADWRRWGDGTRDSASAVRVALRWRDLLISNLEPGDVTGLFRSAAERLDYKALDIAVSLLAGHRALDGVDLWAMTLEVLRASGTAMRPHRHRCRLDPYGSPPLRFVRPLHSDDLRPVSAGDLFHRIDQRHAAEMLMFLASVCAHRAHVASATRAQWRSVCTVEPVAMSHLPSVDMGDWTTITLPAWLDARGLLVRSS